jgi:hypothetical protein
MTRQISSKETIFYKFGLPIALVFGIFMLLNPESEFNNGIAKSDAFRAYQSFLVLFGVIAVYKTVGRLKRVSHDDDMLYISNFREEIRVPLRDVVNISEQRWNMGVHTVTIEFSKQTDFGNKIIFIPALKFFELYRSHRIANELRSLVAEAKQPTIKES